MEFTGERFIPDTDLNEGVEIEHLQRYFSILKLIKDQTVLDAACGEGYGCDLIANYAKFVYGIDIDEETVSHATKKYNKENIQFMSGSIESIPLVENSVDIVISFETIEHVNEETQHTFLEEITRILKKKGTLVISTPDKYIYSDLPNYKNPFHVKEFYKDEFHQFLKRYFKHVQLYAQSVESAYLINDFSNQPFHQSPFINQEYHGKYIVGVCSNTEINANINSIVFGRESNYQHLLEAVFHYQKVNKNLRNKINMLEDEHKKKEQINKNLRERLDQLS